MHYLNSCPFVPGQISSHRRSGSNTLKRHGNTSPKYTHHVLVQLFNTDHHRECDPYPNTVTTTACDDRPIIALRYRKSKWYSQKHGAIGGDPRIRERNRMCLSSSAIRGVYETKPPQKGYTSESIVIHP